MKTVFQEAPCTINIGDVFGLHDEENIKLPAEEYQAIIVDGWGYKEIRCGAKIMYALMKVVNAPEGKRTVPAFGHGKSLHMMERFKGEKEINEDDVENMNGHIMINVIINISNITSTYKYVKNIDLFKSRIKFHGGNFVLSFAHIKNIEERFTKSLTILDEKYKKNIPV